MQDYKTKEDRVEKKDNSTNWKNIRESIVTGLVIILTVWLMFVLAGVN
jgi:hypothetical protein